MRAQAVQKAIWRWASELGRTAIENVLVWVFPELDSKKDLCVNDLWRNYLQKYCEGNGEVR